MRELDAATALCLTAQSLTSSRATRRHTLLYAYPSPQPGQPTDPWMAAGLVCRPDGPAGKTVLFVAVPALPVERQHQALRRVFPPLPLGLHGKEPSRLMNPLCPAVATIAAHSNCHEGLTPSNSDAVAGKHTSRKRTRAPKEAAPTAWPALDPRETCVSNAVLRRVYSDYRQLAGLSFDAPSHLTARAVGEPSIQLAEVRDTLRRVLKWFACSGDGAVCFANYWGSSAQLQRYAEVQMLQCIVALRPDKDQRERLRRWLSRPSRREVRRLLVSTFMVREAANCQDTDVWRNDSVMQVKRVQRRRRATAVEDKEGERTAGDDARPCASVADKIALCMAEKAELTSHFICFREPRQALCLALTGSLPSDAANELAEDT